VPPTQNKPKQTKPKQKKANELAELLHAHKLRSHVNLIPWNPVFGSGFKRPKRERVDDFKAALEAAGLPVSVRSSRGLEAAAACGQLRNSFQKSPLEAPQALT
jgi:23S rRNA (adenine2503-C2)-methyltransferase